jgi:hypothetical protein
MLLFVVARQMCALSCMHVVTAVHFHEFIATAHCVLAYTAPQVTNSCGYTLRDVENLYAVSGNTNATYLLCMCTGSGIA